MSKTPTCIACDNNSDGIPLIQLRYRDGDYWICPQHMPVLIHHPDQLVGKLPGVENLGRAGHQD